MKKLRTYNNPVTDFIKGLLIEQQLLKSGEGSVGVDVTTLLEHVTVTLEVVARSTWKWEGKTR